MAMGPAAMESSTIVETAGLDLLMKETGTYDPATLTRVKHNTLSSLSNLSATSMVSSPAASFESHARSVSDSGMRRAQTVSSAHGAVTEPPTPSPGAKSAIAPTDTFTALKEIHECFISAALGSIVYFLCHDYGFIPLNSRTLILTSSKTSTSDTLASSFMHKPNAITLATLDISLTSLGALVVKSYSDTAPGLQSLCVPSSPVAPSSNLSPGTALWLAPGGNAAKFYGTQDEKNLPGSLPISQLQKSPPDNRHHAFNGATIQSWQSKCLDWLSTKGLNIAALENGGWIFVQVLGGSSPMFHTDYQGIPMLEDLAIVPWPALLCFQTSSNGSRDLQSTPINTTSRDPLSFAEEWFTGRDERASISIKRQKERQIAEAKSREQADVEARNLQSTTYSPAALRRGSNAGAMYPTPPDAPHHPVGATPSFDGTVSTPGNPNQLFDATAQNANPGAMENEADPWSSSGKKDRSNTSMNLNDNDNDNDLFGDPGGDFFEGVTDADFNFFDEPDAVDIDQGSALPEPTVPPNNPEESSLPDMPALEQPTAAPPESTDAIMEDANDIPLQHDRKTTEMQPPSLPKENRVKVEEKNSGISEETHVVSPPFNKEAIFNRLLTTSSEAPPRRASIFNKVDFASSVLSINEKYSANGRFSFSTEDKPIQLSLPLALPRTGYLSRRRRMDEGQASLGLARNLEEPTEVFDIQIVNDEPMLNFLDSELASQMSEQDDTSNTSEDRSMVLNPGVKRKWTVDNEGGEDMASSFNALAVEYEQSVGTPLSISGSQIPLLDGDPADWSLTTYFTSPEPDVQSNALSDLEYIAAAQILADQAVSGTIKLPGPASRPGKDNQASHHRSSSTRELMQTVMKAAKMCFKDVATCNMQSFLEIQGIPVLNQGLRLPPRPTPRGGVLDPSRSNNPFPIPPPQLEVRRADSTLSILPSAVSFWENLGLGPLKGNKDVNAVCVHPDFDGMAGNASTFLDQMQSVYESFRFGSHERVVSKDLANGVLPFTVDSSPSPSNLQNLAGLKEIMARLSRIISSSPIEEKNIVVYFIYPVDNAALLVQICTAFQHLFNLYRRALSEKKPNTANELVLQLLPLDIVASPTSIVVPLPSEYARLAMEVYDRCVNFTLASSAPAVLLEQPLPRSIDFKITPVPSASVLQENKCLHIAYAQSIDDRWITAAWTDNRGTQQMTASYCLGRKNEPISMPFSDVANEIWETTMDIISAKKIHWRVMITRVGVMDPSEIEFWAGLQSTESEAQINLTLLTVQTDPSLRLLPPSITLSPTSNAAQSAITPVSTPQAMQTSIVSPENATPPSRDTGGNAATPGENPAEPDADARLVDYTDQSWGAVLAHRLSNSNSLLELSPALISGYLLKRGGTNLDDPPIVMEVNIVYSEVVGNPRIYHEVLLREILGYYRGLGTLARVRGAVDPVKDVRPWHIAAAEKAVKALYMLM